MDRGWMDAIENKLNEVILTLLTVRKQDHCYEYNELLQIFQGLVSVIQSLAQSGDEESSKFNLQVSQIYFNTIEIYLDETHKEAKKWVKGMSLTDWENMLILLSKFQTLVENLDNAIYASKEDLLWLDKSHSRWLRLFEHTTCENIGDKERVSRSFNAFIRNVAVAQAFMSSGMEETNSVMRRVSIGVTMMYYGLFRDRAVRKAQVFYAKPSIEAAQSVWNILDSSLGTRFFKIIVPSVAFNQVLFLPRLANPITLENVKEYSNIVKQTVNPLQITYEMDGIESKFSLRFDNESNRVPVRLIAPETIRKLEPQNGRSCIMCCGGNGRRLNTGLQFNKLIFHIHGGGFISMSSSSHQNYTRKWVNETKLPLFSIDYRKAPEFPFPAALDDVWQAYNWVKAYAAQYLGIGADKIVVVGDSAGGNLALALSFRCIQEKVPVPSGLILCYPAVNLDKCNFTPSLMRTLEDLVVPHTFLKMCVDSYCPDPEMDRSSNPFISPLKASSELLSKLPPVRMFVGTKDPLEDDCWRMLEKLLDAGVDAKMKIYDGVLHGPLSYDMKGGVPECSVLTQQCVQWINELLG